jgi:hypothetical protein
LQYEPQVLPPSPPELDEISGDSNLKQDDGESKCEYRLDEEKNEDNTDVSKESEGVVPPLPIATLTTHKTENMTGNIEKFGMCEGEGSQWVEWLVNCSR